MCDKKCMSKKEACACVNSFHRRSKKDVRVEGGGQIKFLIGFTGAMSVIHIT